MSAKKILRWGFHGLNRTLGRHGYKIVRTSRLEYILASNKAGRAEFTFAQIGANDGLRFDFLYNFVTSRDACGIVVEPIRDYFDKLEFNYKDFPKIKAVNAAVHPTERELTMYRVDPMYRQGRPAWLDGIASLDMRHHERSGVPREAMKEETVIAVPFMELVAKYGLYSLDLLQVDVEGFDAEVIKMVDFTRVKPKIIRFESERLSFISMDEVRRLLLVNGYRLIDDAPDTIAVLERAVS